MFMKEKIVKFENNVKKLKFSEKIKSSVMFSSNCILPETCPSAPQYSSNV